MNSRIILIILLIVPTNLYPQQKRSVSGQNVALIAFTTTALALFAYTCWPRDTNAVTIPMVPQQAPVPASIPVVITQPQLVNPPIQVQLSPAVVQSAPTLIPPAQPRPAHSNQPSLDILRSTVSDGKVIDKLLRRADTIHDKTLHERLALLKELLEDVKEFWEALEDDEDEKLPEEVEIQEYLERLNTLAEKTDDNQLANYVQQQYNTLANIHIRIRKYTKSNYQKDSGVKKFKTSKRHHRIQSIFGEDNKSK